MLRRILLSDDHKLFREGLKALLERHGHEVVGEATDGREAIRRTRELCPDIVILDIAMPGLNGIDAARAISRERPQTCVILLTVHDEDAYVIDALRAGARGYVLKSQAAADLLQAIDEASRGGIYLSPGVSRCVVEGCLADAAPPPDPLTPREREILQLIAEGGTAKEVAQVLGISAKTSESHRARIMKKLGIHQVAGLVRYAIRQGLIRP